MKVNKNGSRLYAIVQKAEYYNLSAEVINGTWEELILGIEAQELTLPLIVLVMDQGKVMEQGIHEDLIKKKGIYEKMIQ